MSNRITFAGSLPKELILACSGGVDSMVVLDFLVRIKKRKVTVCYFNHGTEHGDDAEVFVKNHCEQNNIPFVIGSISREKESTESKEEFWRNERYNFLDSLAEEKNLPVVTCHHLDDAMETWVFSSLHGFGKVIPYSRNKIIRPFLVCRKEVFVNWATKNNIDYIQDPSNNDNAYMRNLIRNNIMPEALKVNPGLAKVVWKKYLDLC